MTQPDLDSVRRLLPPECGIDSFLGDGGQGCVFRGTWKGQAAAIKLFDASADPERLQRELHTLRQVDSPHVVRILGSHAMSDGTCDRTIVAYELHSGGDLHRFAERANPPLDYRSLLELGRQMGSAIETLWFRKIVHRDIKPKNIVRDGPDRFVLVDLGLARHLDLASLTATGLCAGTLGYMSPEQLQGRKRLTYRSDVFSLGVTLYQLATQQRPFPPRPPIVATPKAADLKKLRRELSMEFCELISEMLEIVPSRRPDRISARFELLLEDEAPCS